MTEKSTQDEAARERDKAAIIGMVEEANKRKGIHLENARVIAKCMVREWGMLPIEGLQELISGD